MKCHYCGAVIKAFPYPEIDEGGEAILVEEGRRRFTPHEWELLYALMARPNRIVRQDFLFDCMYGTVEKTPLMGIIRVFVHNIREKLDGSPYEIENAYGEGYIFRRRSDGSLPRHTKSAAHAG